MPYGKTGIVLFLLLIFGISFYFFYSSESNEALDRAFKNFQEGNFRKAALELNHARTPSNGAHYQLLMSYIAREKGNLEESDEDLKKAESLPDAKKNPQLLMEIYLNQALNAFLQQDPARLSEPLAKGAALDGDKEWLAVFLGISSYLTSSCQEPEKSWQRQIPNYYLSPWMEVVFSKVFTSDWQKIHASRCDIKAGNYLKVRQSLDSGIKLDDADYYFIQGLTYFQEAQDKTAARAIPYYKLAFANLEKVPTTYPDLMREKNALMNQMEERAADLVKQRDFANLNFYTTVLEKAEARPQLDKLSDLMTKELEQEIDDNDWNDIQQLVLVLKDAIGQGQLRNTLQAKFENLLKEALIKGDLTHLDFFWKTLLAFGSNANTLSSPFGDLTAQKILQLIPGDDEKLEAVRPYLNFWMLIEKEQTKRLAFAEDLALLARRLWEQGDEEKAIRVMQAASEIPAPVDQKLFDTLLEEMMVQMHKNAVRADDVDQFPYFLKASALFHFETLNVLDPKEASNQLEDAQFLYRNQRFIEARKRAAWALQVDPKNRQARQIVGMIDYLSGNYKEALTQLKDISNLSPDVALAVLVSQFLTGENDGQQLSQMNLSSDDYLRIGYGLLLAKKPQASLAWFEKASPSNDDDVQAGLTYAYFAMHDFKQALEEYNQLTTPYNKLDGLQGIAVLSSIALGKNEEAEILLLNWLVKEQQPDNGEFPLFFLPFKKYLLDVPELNRHTIAAKFYKEIKNNPEKALFYLEKIKNPNPDVLLAEAELHNHLREYTAALKALEAMPISSSYDPAFKARKTLAEAIAYTGMRDDIRAIDAYKRYQELAPDDVSYKTSYGDLLIRLRLYKQVSALQPPLTKVAKINLLLQQGQAAQASVAAEEYLKQNPPLVEQLQLAAQFLKVKDSPFPKRILDQVKDPGKLSINEKEALVLYWINNGEFYKAQELLKSNQTALQRRPSGLLVLAALSEKAGGLNEALNYWQKVLEIDPLNQEAADKRDKWIVNAKGFDSSNPTQVMRTAEAMINESERSTLGVSSPELSKAHLLLLDLSQKYPHIPEIWYLSGKAMHLLQNRSSAYEAFKKALSIDPYDAKVYIQLGQMAAEERNFKEAIDYVRKALAIEPNDAQAWETLALIHERQGSNLDALGEIQNAVKYQPNSINAWLLLGTLQMRASNPEKAWETFERVLKMQPENGEALKNLVVVLGSKDLQRDKPKEALKNRQKELWERLKAVDSKAADEVKGWLIK